MVSLFKKRYAVVSEHPISQRSTCSGTFITRFFADRWAKSMNNYVGGRYRRRETTWWVVKRIG